MACTCGAAEMKGADLANTINEKLGVIIAADDSLTRDDILGVVAEQAGIELAEAQAIASGEIDAPAAQTLQAFADVLRVDLSDLVDASEDDVEAATEVDEEPAEEKAVDDDEAAVIAADDAEDAEEAEAVDADRVSLKSSEELRAIAADLEGVASRIRRLADEGSEDDVIEITDEVMVIDGEEKSVDSDRLSNMLLDVSYQLASLNLNS